MWRGRRKILDMLGEHRDQLLLAPASILRSSSQASCPLLEPCTEAWHALATRDYRFSSSSNLTISANGRLAQHKRAFKVNIRFPIHPNIRRRAEPLDSQCNVLEPTSSSRPLKQEEGLPSALPELPGDTPFQLQHFLACHLIFQSEGRLRNMSPISRWRSRR